MIKKLLFTAIFLKLAMIGIAQRGMLDNAIGVRLGLGSGVTYQHFFTDQKVFEAIAYQRFGGVNLTLLAEGHEQMFDVRGLKWFYGANGHMWIYNKNSILQENIIAKNSITLNINKILKITFYMHSIPLQFSID